jgi:hypothetical protein
MDRDRLLPTSPKSVPVRLSPDSLFLSLLCCLFSLIGIRRVVFKSVLQCILSTSFFDRCEVALRISSRAMSYA